MDEDMKENEAPVYVSDKKTDELKGDPVIYVQK